MKTISDTRIKMRLIRRRASFSTIALDDSNLLSTNLTLISYRWENIKAGMIIRLEKD